MVLIKLILIGLPLIIPSVSYSKVEPEKGGILYPKEVITAKSYMAVTAHPEATKAAAEILANGGTAVDAAIAAQMVLTLVEPQSSGIGGGAFMLFWHKKTGKLMVLDGREMAPRTAVSTLFQEKGKPMNFLNAYIGGRSVGSPGLVRMLSMAHKKYGRTSWTELFRPAIKLSKEGFKVSHRLHSLLSHPLYTKGIKQGAAAQYFYPQGKALEEGHLLRNPKLAKAFQTLAKSYGEELYTGPLSQRIVKAVQENPKRGHLSFSDLKNYAPKTRDPVCVPLRDYKVCTASAPAGGVTLLQIIAMANLLPAMKDYTSLKTMHIYTQITRLAYADRKKYLADPDFSKLPIQGLLSRSYLQKRLELIQDRHVDHQNITPGTPVKSMKVGDAVTLEQPSTTHMSIVDKYGNAVAMTSSIEMAFGSGIMVDGFLLNNQLTDFSFKDKDSQGLLILNRLEPGKRPLSAMSPVMVFDKSDNLKMVLGSPGGSRIISYVAYSILAAIDGSMDLQNAISNRHISNRNDLTAIERGRFSSKAISKLQSMGHKIKVVDLNSGLHGITLKEGKLVSAVDPRREGEAKGK